MPGPKPTLMRALGLTLGDLWSVIKTGHARGPITKSVVRRDVQEAKLETDAGEVTLRRTTVDEVEFKSAPATSRDD